MSNEKPAGFYTRFEIGSQPDVWRAAIHTLQQNALALHSLFEDGNYANVIFTGCGSPYYLGMAAATLFQSKTGIGARAVPASELWLETASYLQSGTKTLLIAVSRSGETSEVIRACEKFLQTGAGDLLTIVCNPNSRLATMGKVNLTFAAAQEESVAQTRAFSTLYLASATLPMIVNGKAHDLATLADLPSSANTLLQSSAALALQLGSDLTLDRFYFLGSAARYGLACELSLKMKEMTLSHSEPFHFMEFRHGPMSMVSPSTLVVALVSEANCERELAVVAEMQALGGRTVTIGQAGLDVNFGSQLSADLRNVLYLPFGQLMALERSLAKGLNPDRPEKLLAFITLDG